MTAPSISTKSRVEAETGWRDIASAPKDGTVVDLQDADGKITPKARWTICDQGDLVWGVWAWAHTHKDFRPTLWREHLPPESSAPSVDFDTNGSSGPTQDLPLHQGIEDRVSRREQIAEVIKKTARVEIVAYHKVYAVTNADQIADAIMALPQDPDPLIGEMVGALEKIKALANPNVRIEHPRINLDRVWDAADGAISRARQSQSRGTG